MEQSNNKTGIIVGIVAVLAIGAGLLWAVSSKKDDSKKTTNETSQTQQATQQPAVKSPGTIVVLASNTPSLSTLVTAVKAASLVDTLQGQGPFTVFAPTNAAFEALPAGTLESLLKPENVNTLKSILTYHVVPGKILASDLKDGQVIKTVHGGNLTVSIMGGKVYIIDAKGNKVAVEAADINADNGVVHVIGGVLLPS